MDCEGFPFQFAEISQQSVRDSSGAGLQINDVLPALDADHPPDHGISQTRLVGRKVVITFGKPLSPGFSNQTVGQVIAISPDKNGISHLEVVQGGSLHDGGIPNFQSRMHAVADHFEWDEFAR